MSHVSTEIQNLVKAMNCNLDAFISLLKSYTYQDLANLAQSARFELATQWMDDEDAEDLFTFALKIENTLNNR